MFNYSKYSCIVLFSLIGFSYACILTNIDTVKLIGTPGKGLDVSYGEHSVSPGEMLDLSKAQNTPTVKIGTVLLLLIL